ncbi:MAG: hypothetical protein EXQ92_12620 [Alphaproteobacteria bacterium]|nr:hypothetical protein [Alphaproteobacteria bacterium]
MPGVRGFARIASRIAGALLTIGLIALSLGAAAAELIMFDQPGCPWCARWDREIAPIYPKTELGRRSPLRRVDIRATRPEDLKAITGVRYTPTFVLVDGGAEIGRIVGYLGEEQFWSLLQELFDR